MRILFALRMQSLEAKFKKNGVRLSGNQTIMAEHLLATACEENRDHESYSLDSFTRKASSMQPSHRSSRNYWQEARP